MRGQIQIAFKMTMTLSIVWIVLTGAAVAQTQTTATNESNSAPINIEADQLQSSEKEAQSIYQGNVKVTQGTFELLGDHVVIQHPNNQLNHIVATGTPAKFKRMNPKDKTWMYGEAQTITYNAVEKNILLQGDAIVKQDQKNEIKGPELFYDLNNQILTAQGDQNATTKNVPS
jgi:lipopolysaccharide export system protein LptA